MFKGFIFILAHPKEVAEKHCGLSQFTFTKVAARLWILCIHSRKNSFQFKILRTWLWFQFAVGKLTQPMFKILLNSLKTKYTSFQFKYASQLTILKHLCLNHFCPFNYYMLMRAFKYLQCRLELISSITLDCRKDIHSVKSASSISHSDHTAASYRLLRVRINYAKPTEQE